MPIRLPKETVESWLRECSDSETFVCIDGQRAKSVKELVKLFERMSQESYDYHVNKEKNDFAAWVEGVFHNGHLAANFRSARSYKEAYQYVKRHYLMLERNLRDFRRKEERRARRRSERIL
ncbi:MAG: hypothetical protein ACOX6V_03570 [Patescibacteria group bacterium]|jgi:hypothetical protein